MSDNGDKELGLVSPQAITDGRQYHDGFPDHVFQRARCLLLQSGTYAHAYRRLKSELEGKELAPSFRTIIRWGHADKDVMALMAAHEKDGDIGETFRDVAEDYAEGMIEARPHLSYSQMPVAYGIAADKPISWAKVGQSGPVIPIQINITDSQGEKIDQF